MRALVELSGENLALAEAELDALLVGRGTRSADSSPLPLPRLRAIELADEERAHELGRRMGLMRQLLVVRPERLPPVGKAASDGARPTGSTAFRWLGPPPADGPRRLAELMEAFRAEGGRAQLAQPDREFRIWIDHGELRLAERVAEPDRAGLASRRMPRLPYQRPVSLPPKRARALANLGRAGPGTRVVDPFVGTGALLLEAALLGARCTGIDQSDRMVRGAAQNFGHFGASAEAWMVEDAGRAVDRFETGSFDLLLTDPPYGRASTTGGEEPVALLERALSGWTSRLAPGGRIALAVPQGTPSPVAPPWRCTVAVADRVHRSLVREFRVYGRAAEGNSSVVNDSDEETKPGEQSRSAETRTVTAAAWRFS
ncbi:MAG: RsmD family RNA methyltransferase [Thermoplasmata archaeon]|nr:RsmD family RNA methyltransferase [Thermoplasmata archaeon]MCI4341986.1 RsmD family RNA methyltransferase [Thermoplasmata archaeon]